MDGYGEMLKTGAAIAAVIISTASFIIARMTDRRSKKSELIKNLLGEKENVAFGALKLLREGIPKDKADRQKIISAVMQACLFEGSDRARALLYRVIDKNKAIYANELLEGLSEVKANFESLEKYNLTSEELDLARGRKRLAIVEKVITHTAS